MTALPTWATTLEAKLLLSNIVADRPERTRPITEMVDGTAVDYGYASKDATRLRKMFHIVRDEMLQVLPHSDEAREGFIAWCRDNSSDAIIERLLAPAWVPCAGCEGRGYSTFDPWDHANDVTCAQCDGRGGETK